MCAPDASAALHAVVAADELSGASTEGAVLAPIALFTADAPDVAGLGRVLLDQGAKRLFELRSVHG